MSLELSEIYSKKYYEGKIKKKYNKNWIILNKNNKKKWYLLGNYLLYNIIDNGGEPYKVIITEKKIYIFTKYLKINKLIKIIKNYNEIFIGENKIKYSDYTENFVGSSILVELNNNNYIFIGMEIYKFKTKEKINKFYSIMGNSMVPYPYGKTDKYIYLMIENVYLERNFTNIHPYLYYYNHDKKYNNIISHKYKIFKYIENN